jgi:hypothetical protein
LNDLKLNSFVFHGRPSQCEEAEDCYPNAYRR